LHIPADVDVVDRKEYKVVGAVCEWWFQDKTAFKFGGLVPGWLVA
jgi:hypothetical protein